MQDKKYLQSKKAIGALVTKSFLFIFMLAVLWASGGDPEKAKVYLEAYIDYALLLTSAGVAGVASQGAVDMVTAFSPKGKKK